jgi:hypothetical protein
MYFFIPAHRTDNKKLGQMPCVYAPRSTCPPKCPLTEACYATKGLCVLVAKMYARDTFENVLNGITSIHEGLSWRYGVLGDLPGCGNRIDKIKLKKLVAYNRFRKGFTYTHKPLDRSNLPMVKWANKNGFTINISLESIAKVDEITALGLPSVVVVASTLGNWRRLYTPAGNVVLRCLAEYSKIQCAFCGGRRGPLCARGIERGFSIGLTSHGNCRKKLDEMLT